MGIVYLAYDPQMTREVAVKVLPGHLTNDPEFRDRLEREVRTVANLEHPCIVPVYDYGEENGQPYVVMRYMPGDSLLNRIKQNPLTPTELSPIIHRVARALDKAHSHHIIHRDIKPGNILFDDQGQAYLSDFGLAKVVQDAASKTGSAIIGTPAYMSPEQGSGSRKLDGRSDIYGLGIIIFEALTGQLPYHAETPIGLVMQHLTKEIPSIRQFRPELSPDFETIIRQAMAKTPDRRYATATDLAEDLAALVNNKDVQPRPELQGEATEPVVGLSDAVNLSSRPTPVPVNPEPAEPSAEGKGRNWGILIGTLAVLGLAVLALGVGAIIMLTGGDVDEPGDSASIAQNPKNRGETVAANFTSTPTLTPSPTETVMSTATSPPSATATATPAPSPTPTPVPPSPTPTATVTTRPPPPTIISENSLILDNFELYAGNADLNNAFQINNAWNVNKALLKLVGAPHATEGNQAIAFEFEITNPAPNHYSGFERSVPPQDWSDYSLLCFWLESDGSGYDLIIQFGEKNSETWKHTIALSTLETAEVCRSLSAANFQWADWSPQGNNQIDLDSIAYYGFYVEGPPQGPGVIYVDNFRVTNPSPTPTPPPTETLTPTPAVVICATEPEGEFRILWQRHKSRLGCPTEKNPVIGFFAEQPFQNGHMFWSEIGNFYLVTLGDNTGAWHFFEGNASIWQDGMPQYSCNLATPPGYFHPIRGFGGLWCGREDIREQIGWGLKKEEGFQDMFQTFERGIIFRDSDGASRGLAYVMFQDNGAFIRESY